MKMLSTLNIKKVVRNLIPTDKPFELHVPVTSMPDFKGQPKITRLDIPVKKTVKCDEMIGHDKEKK